MNKQLVINQQAAPSSAAPVKRRFSPLFITACIAYLLIFNAVFIYLKQPKTYNS